MIRVESSFDDGSIFDLRVADMMYNFNIATTFYIPVNHKKHLLQKGIEPLSDNNVRDIASTFRIGSHGIDHELLTRVSDDVAMHEIHDSKEYWHSKGIEVDSFCYPRGYYTEDIKNMVRSAGYITARTVKVGELSPPIDPIETHTTIHIGLDRKEYGCTWVQYGKKMIEKALEKEAMGEDVVFHFWGHSEEIHRNNQWDNMGKFMQSLRENIL